MTLNFRFWRCLICLSKYERTVVKNIFVRHAGLLPLFGVLTALEKWKPLCGEKSTGYVTTSYFQVWNPKKKLNILRENYRLSFNALLILFATFQTSFHHSFFCRKINLYYDAHTKISFLFLEINNITTFLLFTLFFFFLWLFQMFV